MITIIVLALQYQLEMKNGDGSYASSPKQSGDVR